MTEKRANQVGFPVPRFVHSLDEPCVVSAQHSACHRATLKWWIAHERIESAASEYFGKFHGPMEGTASAHLLAGVGLKFRGGVTHPQLGVVGGHSALLIVGVTIVAAQFKGDEAVGESLYLGGGGLGFSVQAMLGFDLDVVVGRKVFEGTAFGGGFLQVAEQVGGGKGHLVPG